MAYFFMIVGMIAVFFPFDSEAMQPDPHDTTSLWANLGGEGLSVIIRVCGGVFLLLGITMVFS